MKKLLAVLMTFVIIGSVLVACSKANDDPTKPYATEGISTEEAKIKESNAIKFIETQYTAEELGLDKLDKNYQFMIASTGVEIDGVKYVKVVANVPVKNDTTAENGQETYSMQTYGEYFISFDGETVMMRNQETGELKKLENRYADYSQKGDAESADKQDTKKSDK